MELVRVFGNCTPRCNFVHAGFLTLAVSQWLVMYISLHQCQMLSDDDVSGIDHNLVLKNISTLLRGFYIEILLLFIIGLFHAMPFLKKRFKDNRTKMVTWLVLDVAFYSLLAVFATYGDKWLDLFIQYDKMDAIFYSNYLMILGICAFQLFMIKLLCLHTVWKIMPAHDEMKLEISELKLKLALCLARSLAANQN